MRILLRIARVPVLLAVGLLFGAYFVFVGPPSEAPFRPFLPIGAEELACTFLAYFLSSFVAGFVWRVQPLTSAAWLAAPQTLMVVALPGALEPRAFSEPQILLEVAGRVAAVVVPALLGAAAGSWVRSTWRAGGDRRA